ncbi:MAG: DUF3160 domain-containing protein [Lachnospiraceae bacterium]|nr:DUF3160 domain-containing protein [Lachnospiraceae bacterium]
MICPKCNHENEKDAKYCGECGADLTESAQVDASEGPASVTPADVEPSSAQPEAEQAADETPYVKKPADTVSGNAVVYPMSNPGGGSTSGGDKKWVLPLVIALSAAAVIFAGIVCTAVIVKSYRNSVRPAESAESIQEADKDTEDRGVADAVETEEGNENEAAAASSDRELNVEKLERPSIIDSEAEDYYDKDLVPSVADYAVKPDLSNIYNQADIEYLPDKAKAKLAKNLFVVMDERGFEFYDIYEGNRYGQTPNFITVDSMMHTYHVYFSYLLKKLEKEDLLDEVEDLTEIMYDRSLEQYEALKGSEWEDAALMNVEFFAVAGSLLDEDVDIPKPARENVEAELDLIDDGAVSVSPVFGDFEDYSQYKPRGYYVGDEDLEKYFRCMMWYGRRGFEQREEKHMRSALLMTIAMDGEALNRWEGIYTVTSFFAGASDDETYYELKPLVDAAYGRIDDVAELIGDEDRFFAFYDATVNMEPPKINSIPVFETDEENVIPSFRFMGQRFSIDAAIFQNLMYRSVEENEKGDKRMLPDALDIPAVLGSETAYKILEEQGDTAYVNYPENVKKLQDELAAEEDSELWTASLYAQWLNTLRPMLTPKGEGYPLFMQSDEWNKRTVEGFLGSYAELKHDTILYSKQAMAEMGGGWDEEVDDRGYAEPEPVVYSRFAKLAENTATGLKKYGLLAKDDKDNLNKMAEMAKMLVTISEKELRDETLTEEEYDFIRDYGGDIEHIWADATRDEENEYPRSDEHPGAIVADVATDPNGSVLELGTGEVGEIYVVCPIAGKIKVCTGAVYSFYEFKWPLSDRLTDEQWRQKLGIWPVSGYDFKPDESIKQPEWTQSYRAQYEWNY